MNKLSTEWQNNAPLEICINLKEKDIYLNFEVFSEKNFVTYKSKSSYLKFRKFSAVEFVDNAKKDSRTLGYSYKSSPGFYINFIKNEIIVYSDEISSLCVFYLIIGDHLFVANTYGDIVRLAKRYGLLKLKDFSNCNAQELFDKILQAEFYWPFEGVFAALNSNSYLLVKDEIISLKYKTFPFEILEELQEEHNIKKASIKVEEGFASVVDKYLNLNSDLKIGSTLSGGDDSAIVTFLLKKFYDRNLESTYSILMNKLDQSVRVNFFSKFIDVQNFSVYLWSYPLESIDCCNPYLELYMQPYIALTKLALANKVSAIFTGLGGDEVLNYSKILEKKLTNLDVDSVKSIPYISLSTQRAAFVTHPIFLRYGIYPFTVFAIPDYVFSLLSIEDSLKENKKLYKFLGKQNDFPKEQLQYKQKDSFRNYFDVAFSKKEFMYEDKIKGFCNSCNLENYTNFQKYILFLNLRNIVLK